MIIQYFRYIKASLLSLVAVTFPFALIEQFIYMEAKSSQSRVLLGLFGMVLSLVETFLVFLALGRIVHYIEGQKTEFGVYLKTYLRDIVIETFRAMGGIAVGFLLIFPGSKRATQYCMVPFIVQFDPKYQKGEVDVLTEAKTLLEGHFFRCFGALCLTQMVM